MEICSLLRTLFRRRTCRNTGLAPPTRTFVLHAESRSRRRQRSNANEMLAELNFGATHEGKMFVRRADENSVYAVNTNQLAASAVIQLANQRLSGLQFHRERGSASRNTSARRSRQMVRNGPPRLVARCRLSRCDQ